MPRSENKTEDTDARRIGSFAITEALAPRLDRYLADVTPTNQALNLSAAYRTLIELGLDVWERKQATKGKRASQ